jgi:hypothetical protein
MASTRTLGARSVKASRFETPVVRGTPTALSSARSPCARHRNRTAPRHVSVLERACFPREGRQRREIGRTQTEQLWRDSAPRRVARITVRLTFHLTWPSHPGRKQALRPARSAAVARIGSIICALPSQAPSGVRHGRAPGIRQKAEGDDNARPQAVATAQAATAKGAGGKHHPLTPLSAAEIAAAVSTLQASADFVPTTRIVSVMLSEPSKAAVYDGVKVRNPPSPSCLRVARDAVYRGSTARRSGQGEACCMSRASGKGVHIPDASFQRGGRGRRRSVRRLRRASTTLPTRRTRRW